MIIGAGLGGLSAALCLLKRGFDVEVCEQADSLGEVGAGVQIGPNASKVLEDLGLTEDLAKVAFKPVQKVVRIWNTAETFPAIDLSAEAVERYGAPYYTLHRADLYSTLLAGVRQEKPNAIRLGHRCRETWEQGQEVVARFENGETASAAALVGADGVHSKVRQNLFGADKATYTGMMSWRGVIPMERLPEHLAQPVATNWVGPHGHVVHYPLRRGELMNVNAVVERSDWEGESWTMRGTTEECLADFAGWHPEVHALLGSIDRPFKWALLRREELRSWTKGRITLLGDACHSMVPFLAQGASMAIEDGLVLARAIEKHWPDVRTALAAYEHARRERAYGVVRGSSENIRRFHNPLLADPKTAAEYVAGTWGGNKVGNQLDWIFTYDPRTALV